MRRFLLHVPSAYLALVAVPAAWAVITILSSVYWRCIQPDVTGQTVLDGLYRLTLLAGIGLALANGLAMTRQQRWLDAAVFGALAALGAAGLAFDIDSLLLAVALAYGVVAPLLAAEARFPLPSPLMIPAFLLGGLLMQDDDTLPYARLIVAAGLALFLLMTWQQRAGVRSRPGVRSLAASGALGVLAVPLAVLAMVNTCDAGWCYDSETYGPVIERLRGDVPDDAAVVTVLDPGTYDRIFQRCRLESAQVYRAFYPTDDPEQADAMMSHVLDQYHQVYGVYVDADLAAYDADGLIESRLQSMAYRASDRYHNLVRVAHYGVPTATLVTQPVEAGFGDQITLLEASYAPQVEPGHVLPVALTWQSDAAHDYTAGVYLLDAAGQLVAQHDTQPDWATLAGIHQRSGLALPPSLPHGVYTLHTAVYNASGRLPVQVGGAVHGDLLQLAEIRVGVE